MRKPRLAAVLVATLILSSCDELNAPGPWSPTPASLSAVSGDRQEGVAGAGLADSLAVRVVDAHHRPVAGVVVRFAVASGGGRLTGERTPTDQQGMAYAWWTLGTAAADSQVVEASLAAAPGVAPVRLHATAQAGAAATLRIGGGNGAAGQVGAALGDSLQVEVADRFGNPVAGREVTWAVTAGGGSLSPSPATTGSRGVAKAQWTLGPRVDSVQVALARVAGLDPVSFTASATTVGVPLQLAKRGGDGQTGPVGAVLADSLGVSLRMSDGRPVRGALVAWRVAAGAGTVTPTVSRTDANGAAAAAWRLGTVPGPAQATATVDVGTLAFISLVHAEAPVAVTAASGGGEGPVGGALADSLAARVTDPYGNPVPGVEVAWAAGAGSGTVQPAHGTTDAQGIARASWTLAAVVGRTQLATATVGTLPPAGFQATAITRGVPLVLARTGGEGQSRTVGMTLADSLSVQLHTQGGTPVEGATVAWAAASGGGQLSPSSSRTDAQGRARAAWSMGTASGPARASATVDQGVLVFTATALAAEPASVHAVAGDGQTAVRGSILAAALVARVLDRYGNPVPNAWVHWAVTAGAGHVEADSSRTGADGEARTRWAVGLAPAIPNRAAATAAGASAAEFSAASAPGELLLARISPAIVPNTTTRTRYLIDRVVSFSLKTAAGSPVPGVEFQDGPVARFRTDWTGVAQYRWQAAWYHDPPEDPPILILDFEDQFIWFAPNFPGVYRPTIELVDPDRPVYPGDSVRLRVDALEAGRRHADGISVVVQDEDGWSATALAGEVVLWPAGAAGSHFLNACLEGAICTGLWVDVLARP